ncbi:helix-turn-helix transcriptional regulator [Streptomyces cinereospinus]
MGCPSGDDRPYAARRLGAALKAYRLAAKMDQVQAAEVIAAHQTRVSRIETGHVSARPLEIRALLDAYAVRDVEVRQKLEGLARQSKRRGWWLEHAAHLRPDYVDHIALEDDATYIREWQPVMVPGLLQTPAYAEAVIAGGPHFIDPERVAQLVTVRVGRQAKIEGGGASYTAILWEAVITHPLVGVDIHRDQLSAILEIGKRKNVTVQVLPFSAGALAGATSAFFLLQLR